MNRYGKRCVLYPRVSTEMQVDGYSLEGQKNMLTRFADREEMIVVDTYEDAGKSGKSIEGRPAFQKMLRDIEDGLDIDYILVYKLSRFGRNAADILNSLELVQSYGVNLICIEEGIDSSQTSGKLLISVLSAVAEIERENIIEQTMNGRREKARQGGWNGGFAPYGYTLEDNKLMIEETEAVAIRKIFELYTSSEIGLGGIANQLNLQGIRKIPRQNGTLEDWTGHFIKLILDNPVYCGKIAYGRRTKEKVKGTKNDYQMKRNDDYILTEGQHKGIVSEEIWEKAHAKRLRTGVKQPSKIGRDRVHLLSGLLKCPVCGSPMYTNKHAWTNKDGTYKEIYYYVCSRNRMVRGKHCEYKAMLKKTDIEPMVIEAIREIVRNEEYAQAIKKRIGVQIDTKAVDKELEGYQAKLKEVDLNKTRLEREIDSLPADAKYRERKLHDMTLRLDSLYDVIVELEEKIEDARFRRDAIKQQAITLENIYKIMVNFDCVYNIINDEEKRNVVTALIKEIEIYRNDESEYPLKRIGLNFPVFKDGGEVTELLWDKGNTVDAVLVLHRERDGWRVQRMMHRMGRPLMEPMIWSATSGKPFGRSRLKKPIRTLIDDYIRTVANATIALEFDTTPQKYILGVTDDQYDAIVSDKFKQYVGSLLAATSNPETGENPVFGQLAQGSLSPHVEKMRMTATQFAAATGLTVTDVGIINDANPTSSDAILAQSQTLVLLAQQLNTGNGDALRTIACMAQAIAQNKTLDELTEEESGIMAHFKNPAMPSVAVTADAAIKIASARQEFASTDTFLEMIGFDQADIRRIKSQEQRVRGQQLLMELNDEADTVESMA